MLFISFVWENIGVSEYNPPRFFFLYPPKTSWGMSFVGAEDFPASSQALLSMSPVFVGDFFSSQTSHPFPRDIFYIYFFWYLLFRAFGREMCRQGCKRNVHRKFNESHSEKSSQKLLWDFFSSVYFFFTEAFGAGWKIKFIHLRRIFNWRNFHFKKIPNSHRKRLSFFNGLELGVGTRGTSNTFYLNSIHNKYNICTENIDWTVIYKAAVNWAAFW